MAESKIGIGGWMWVGNACRQKQLGARELILSPRTSTRNKDLQGIEESVG